jgi:hypothetical protein
MDIINNQVFFCNPGMAIVFVLKFGKMSIIYLAPICTNLAYDVWHDDCPHMKRLAGDSKGGGFSKKPPLAAGGKFLNLHFTMISIKIPSYI